MQSPFSKDYFDLFDLPVSYNVDLDKLAIRYRELQHTVHPDKYTSSSDQERRLSLQLTAQVNQAYQTLKSPILRAEYMLDMHGAKPGERDIVMSPEFLNEQMELRERLSEVATCKDPRGELIKMDNKLKERTIELQKSIAQQFIIGTADAFKNAGKIFLEMQFIGKLQHEIADLEMELTTQ